MCLNVDLKTNEAAKRSRTIAALKVCIEKYIDVTKFRFCHYCKESVAPTREWNDVKLLQL